MPCDAPMPRAQNDVTVGADVGRVASEDVGEHKIGRSPPPPGVTSRQRPQSFGNITSVGCRTSPNVSRSPPPPGSPRRVAGPPRNVGGAAPGRRAPPPEFARRKHNVGRSPNVAGPGWGRGHRDQT